MTRFFGVLSSHASLRAEVVPPPRTHLTRPELLLCWAQTQLRLFDAPARPSRHPWSSLLKHVFLEVHGSRAQRAGTRNREANVTVCPKCTGPMRWLQLATTPDAIARALAHHPDLGADIPRDPATRRRPARAPPPEQLAFGFAQAGG